ncbi:MAG: transcriptional repressor [Thermodesulfovibrionales bacterium]|nr:transcriptional repressor [Thermodesulfovibrionales bacterium]
MRIKKFKDYLSEKGLKTTKKRDEILNEISSIEGHFDLDELFVRLKQKGSKISRASIYRTIPLLIESGFITEVERVDRHAHYEKVSQKKHHDHMICLKCSAVIEFYSPELESLQDDVCKKKGFKGVRHNLEIYGYCKKCRT